MNSFWRSGAVIAALAGLLTTVVSRYESIISNTLLLWVAIGAAAVVACLCFSWGWTQVFKFFCIDDAADLSAPEPTKTDISAHADWLIHTLRPRRKVYACAMATFILPAGAIGSSLVLTKLVPDTLYAEIIFWTIWTTGTLLFTAADPWLWKVLFVQVIPWILARDAQSPNRR